MVNRRQPTDRRCWCTECAVRRGDVQPQPAAPEPAETGEITYAA
jgi:hypothetical protein